MSPEARERSFDELARGLASGSISRRRALRLMGAALVGGALASIPGVAQAARCGATETPCGSVCCPAGATCERGFGSPRCTFQTLGCPGGCPEGTNCCNPPCCAEPTTRSLCCRSGYTCVEFPSTHDVFCVRA